MFVLWFRLDGCHTCKCCKCFLQIHLIKFCSHGNSFVPTHAFHHWLQFPLLTFQLAPIVCIHNSCFAWWKIKKPLFVLVCPPLILRRLPSFHQDLSPPLQFVLLLWLLWHFCIDANLTTRSIQEESVYGHSYPCPQLQAPFPQLVLGIGDRVSSPTLLHPYPWIEMTSQQQLSSCCTSSAFHHHLHGTTHHVCKHWQVPAVSWACSAPWSDAPPPPKA